MRTMPLHGTSTFSTFRPSSRSSARRRFVLGMAAFGFISAMGAPALTRHSRARRRVRKQLGRIKSKRKFLPPFVVDAFIGAIGEVGQLAVLYPLDTIKVRCQAQGSSTTAVWAVVKSRGFNLANLSSLFAGCAPSAVCAALIGACYLASFCTAKRLFAGIPGSSPDHNPGSLVTANSCEMDDDCSLSHQEASSSGYSSRGVLRQRDTAANDTAAAVVASLLTSILEAPVELFRHRMQAGLSQGRMLANMATAFGGGGLGSLYWGYAPFLLKGIPYDVAELFSYSQLSKSQDSIPLLSSLPTTCRDCFIGALAGAAAVIFSMPADCIKTRMELSATRPPPGLLRGSAAFFRTGRSMLAERGPKCLFVGLTPRLLENVPSTMFYWVLVAALRRALQPLTNDGQQLEAAAV